MKLATTSTDKYPVSVSITVCRHRKTQGSKALDTDKGI